MLIGKRTFQSTGGVVSWDETQVYSSDLAWAPGLSGANDWCFASTVFAELQNNGRERVNKIGVRDDQT